MTTTGSKLGRLDFHKYIHVNLEKELATMNISNLNLNNLKPLHSNNHLFVKITVPTAELKIKPNKATILL